LNESPKRPKYTGPKKSKNTKDIIISYWGIWLILAFLLVFSLVKISGYSTHHVEVTAVAEASKPPVFGKAAYVGSTRCKDCHWKKHDTWKNTLHSKFMQSVNEYTILGDFEINNTFTTKVTNNSPVLAGNEITSRMFKKDGKFYVNTIGPDWKSHDYEIANVIGIGRRQNYLTKFPNGEIHLLPVEWDIRTKSWVDLNGLKKSYPGNSEYWSSTERIWQYKCGGCHVTGIEINYDKNNDSFDTTWVDLGIGCEACHGPGSNHVRAASEYFDYEKENIINPSKLPWRLRAMVCGQCHNWGASTADITDHEKGYPKKYSYAYGFMPGKPLYLSYVEELDNRKKHHQQYNEWSKSEHAKAGIMCTNCHDVHQEEDLKSAMTKFTPDSLCMNCHKTRQRRAAHRIHTFGSCVACHMPKTIGHEHSHTFQFISPELSILAGGVDKQPNSCNGCHHHKDTPPENLVGFLDAAKKEDMPKPFNVHRKPKPSSKY
jgi:predicted CXXCH cytochrome family protein